MKRHRFDMYGLLAVLLLGGLLTLSTASAEENFSLKLPRPPEEIIKLFDSNGDNQIDRTELRLKIISVFDQLDTNKDGALTLDELPGLPENDFEAADKNRDGKLDPFEYIRAEFLNFDNIDKNNDGYITVDEIVAFQKRPKVQ